MRSSLQGKTKDHIIFATLAASARTGGESFLEEIKNNPNLLKECDRDGNTLLHKAVDKDNTEDLLLGEKAKEPRPSLKGLKGLLDYEYVKENIDAQNKRGETALCSAVFGFKTGTATLLIEHGADVTIPNNDGKTALHSIAEYPNFGRDSDDFTVKNCAELLLRKGANINARDKQGRMPLHVAIKKEIFSDERLDFLLQIGADPNVQDNEGDTALHYAIRITRSQAPIYVVNLLLEHGANWDIKNNKGESPLTIAKSLSNKRSVDDQDYGKDLLNSFEEHIKKRTRDRVLACTALAVGALAIYYRKDITAVIKGCCSIIVKAIKDQSNKIEVLNGVFK
ncbi:MAG: ank1u7 [Candidatus Midichloriaceae bacterium]|jgi:ankyrin repeat protein|nr:ank1u7 [Candidatus Midichloriaceae bacterium]